MNQWLYDPEAWFVKVTMPSRGTPSPTEMASPESSAHNEGHSAEIVAEIIEVGATSSNSYITGYFQNVHGTYSQH